MPGNLAIARMICAAWERGEYLPGPSTEELAAELVHPEIEFVVVGGPEPSSRRGLEAIAPSSDAFLALWEEFRVVAEEYRELDGERVLVLTRNIARGMISGVEIDQRRASVFEFAGGRVVRIVNYWERERALADLGIAPGG